MIKDTRSHFIVRIPEYIHRTDFPDRCAEALEYLKARPLPEHFQDFMSDLSNAVKLAVPNADGFGEIRERYTNTLLNKSGNYLPCAQRIITEQYAKDLPEGLERALDWEREYFDDSADPPIELGRVVRNGFKPEAPSFLDGHGFQQGSNIINKGELILSHCLVSGGNNKIDTENYHRAMERLEKSYAQVVGATPLEDGKTKEEAALHCYYLFSQIMPFRRGSSTSAKLMLERLADVAGFETHNTAAGYDLNIEAMTHHWSRFYEKYKAGIYSDIATPDHEILVKHKFWAEEQVRQKNHKSSASWAQLVERAFALADTSKQTPVFSVLDALLSFMLVKQKHPHIKNISVKKLHEEFLQHYPEKAGNIRMSKAAHNCTIRLGNSTYQENGQTLTEPCLQFDLTRDKKGKATSDAQTTITILTGLGLFNHSLPIGQTVRDRVTESPDIQITLSGKVVKGQFVELNTHDLINQNVGLGRKKS